MIKPAGHRVLVECKDITEFDPTYARAKAAGIQIARDHEDHQRRQAGVDKGVVVAVGPTAFKDFGGEPWCVPGDLIIFAKYAGKIVEDVDQKKYIVLNDEDICAVIKEAA